LSDQLAAVEDQLLQEQLKPPNQQDHNLQQQLTDQHHKLLIKDEEFSTNVQRRIGLYLGTETLPIFTRLLSKGQGKIESHI
jgi:hypothetical protein